MNGSLRHRATLYTVVLLGVVAAVGVRAAVDPWLGDFLPFVTLYGAVGSPSGAAAGHRVSPPRSSATSPATSSAAAARNARPRRFARLHGLHALFLVDGTTRTAGSTASAIALEVTEMGAAQQALREADRREDEFLATLVHELRNPLGAIRR